MCCATALVEIPADSAAGQGFWTALAPSWQCLQVSDGCPRDILRHGSPGGSPWEDMDCILPRGHVVPDMVGCLDGLGASGGRSKGIERLTAHTIGRDTFMQLFDNIVYPRFFLLVDPAASIHCPTHCIYLAPSVDFCDEQQDCSSLEAPIRPRCLLLESSCV